MERESINKYVTSETIDARELQSEKLENQLQQIRQSNQIGVCNKGGCNNKEVNCGLCKEHYPGFAESVREVKH